jgi:hypothetical protein
MRALAVAALAFSILTLLFDLNPALAGSDSQESAVSDGGKTSPAEANTDKYRGYFLDVSQIAGQQNYSELTNSLHHQIDIAETVGLSPRVLKFFHKIPIVVDEAACTNGMKEDKSPIFASACYVAATPNNLRHKSTGGSLWDNKKSEWVNPDPVALAEDTHLGVIMARTRTMNPQLPVLLHEMLHAYHADMMADGFNNRTIKHFYDNAKGLYPANAYLMTNEREFFAVTASVFLYGKDDKEPFTRSKIKDKQPDYYKFLGWLFEINPDQGTPVASAD